MPPGAAGLSPAKASAKPGAGKASGATAAQRKTASQASPATPVEVTKSRDLAPSAAQPKGPTPVGGAASALAIQSSASRDFGSGSDFDPSTIPWPADVRPASPSEMRGGGGATLAPEGAEFFPAVGHSPAANLNPQDEALFRAFQSNLLSLISHELRTPLMGILNALGLLEEGAESPGFSATELVTMARQNAQRLHRALSALLDLAALDSGTFHARLREVDLTRLAGGRVDAHRSLLRDRGIHVDEHTPKTHSAMVSGVLADPQKLGRAIDLCLQAIVPRAETGTELHVHITSTQITLGCTLIPGTEPLWDAAWTQASVGFQGGVASPSSAFAGVMQSEQAFLTRMEEGLGSEFLLVHEILRLHRGKFLATRDGSQIQVILELPELSSEEGVQAVLSSRAYEVSTELASVAVVLIQIPASIKNPESFTHEVRKNLFRASDSVYWLKSRGQLALVLDDCKPEDAPRLMERMTLKLQSVAGGALEYGAAQCPSDGPDPATLLELAASRLRQAKP